MQQHLIMRVPAFQILLGNNLKALFPFQNCEDRRFGNASGNLAIVVIAIIGLKAVGISFLPELFVCQRRKPLFDFLHVIELYHELRISDLRFRVQAYFCRGS